MMSPTIGTPVPVEQHGNGIISQADLFMHKARECKSAPVRAFERQASSSSSSSRCSSALPNNSNKKRSNKKHNKLSIYSWKKCVYFFFANAPEFTNWTTSFSSTSRMKYLSLFFVETFLRSIGDVTFCSNPFSGLLIFLGMLISCPLVAFLAFVTLTFGIETAVVFLRLPLNEVRGGGPGFNNFLTGTVVALLAQDHVVIVLPDIILTCTVIGILTIVIWKGLNGLLATRLEFPLLNAPFHVMILLYIFSGMSERYKEHGTSQIVQLESLPLITGNSSINLNSSLDLINNLANETSQINLEPSDPPASLNPPEAQLVMNNRKDESLDWEKVFTGILLAPSHVFGTDCIETSLLVHSAVLLYSPIMLMQTLTGALIGTLMGILLTQPDEREMVYDGSWAYNPLFTSAALGGFFLIFNVYSWLLSLVGSILTTLLYSAMVKLNIPALGIPFMLTTWLLLPSIPLTHQPDSEEASENSSNSGPFLRLHLNQITTPELNRAMMMNQEGTDPTNKYKSKASSVVPQSSTSYVLPL